MATKSSDNLTRFALSGLSNMCGGAGEMSVFRDYFLSACIMILEQCTNPGLLALK